MRTTIWLVSVLLLVSMVSALVDTQDSVYLYEPQVDALSILHPFSALQAYHLASPQERNQASVRILGRDYPPVQLRLVKQLDIRKRWDRTGYTAVYGLDRTVIVPWQPNRVILIQPRVQETPVPLTKIAAAQVEKQDTASENVEQNTETSEAPEVSKEKQDAESEKVDTATDS